MMRFKLAKEIRGDRTVVEVWKNRVLIATIYPHEDSVAVVSKYFEEVETDKAFPPKVTVKFEVGC